MIEFIYLNLKFEYLNENLLKDNRIILYKVTRLLNYLSNLYKWSFIIIKIYYIESLNTEMLCIFYLFI